MEIKAIRMFDGGFMNQQFAFGGEGKDNTDEQIIYRSSLQNFLIDINNYSTVCRFRGKIITLLFLSLIAYRCLCFVKINYTQ